MLQPCKNSGQMIHSEHDSHFSVGLFGATTTTTKTTTTASTLYLYLLFTNNINNQQRRNKILTKKVIVTQNNLGVNRAGSQLLVIYKLCSTVRNEK